MLKIIPDNINERKKIEFLKLYYCKLALKALNISFEK